MRAVGFAILVFLVVFLSGCAGTQTAVGLGTNVGPREKVTAADR